MSPAPDIDIERVPIFLEQKNDNVVATTTTKSSDIYRQSLSDQAKASPAQTISYMLVFFLAMIGHELALEAASTEFSFVESIAYSVTLFQFGFCLLLPLIVSQGSAVSKLPRSCHEAFPFLRLSWVVFGATALASRSLKWVTFPTRVVFKSAKLIPTMMVATVLQGKRYGWLDYLAALLICVGAAGYAMDSSHVTHGGPVKNNSVPGLALLLMSILCDAVVPNLQQQLMSSSSSSSSSSSDTSNDRCRNLSAAELMVNVNAMGFVQLLLYMTGTSLLQETIATCTEYPRLVVYLVLVGMGLSTAVLAYTRLIATSGSVVAVTVATLRKVVTVVLSFVVFPNKIFSTTVHGVASLAVLAGIGLSTVNKFSTTNNSSNK